MLNENIPDNSVVITLKVNGTIKSFGWRLTSDLEKDQKGIRFLQEAAQRALKKDYVDS